MLEAKSTESRDYARFQLALPEHVLQTAIEIDALWRSTPTEEDDCEYCAYVMAVAEDDIKRLEVCEHYERIGKVCGIIDELERSLTEEEQGLLRQSSHLKYASEKAWGYSRPDWRGIPEGFYAVPDPREGVEEMTYWRRKDAGKQKNPEFKPWQPRGAKVRYGPTLLTNDPRLKKLKGEDRNRFIRAWFENVGNPYLDAIIETVLEEPLTCATRFAEWNMRCCVCSKALTHEESKTLGIGPECGKGLPKEVLAEHFQMQVGRLHATSL